ncbi:hypothetical protein T440DRAFT_392703 [Plenodomus tracheiphilus IPT5]|uniref:Ribonuclease H2 subunit B n=1 Tax=Plenodomus tracheiphilus IPT5 TaxID=1408161 RepID=A0A6A7BA79_9PLEO|nr:hypothetical protein T440DRAFT_392703 [Plenodomus tracheiphilus IPT5]
MARTRSKPASKAKESTPEPTASTIKPLPKPTSNPPKLFVLPKDTSKDARIVTLDNPANDTPSRYYFCPQKGFYEFTRIAAPKKDCRSWLITGDAESEDVDAEETGDMRIGSGYITSAADLFIATPIDVLFLILPALAPKSAKDTKQHFLAFDDYLDKLSSFSQHWKVLLAQFPSLKSMVEKRMQVLCDTVSAGDEPMYRISHEKLTDTLLKKAERMVKTGLPPSLEEKFVKTALEVPVMSIRREDSTLSAISSTETVTPDDASTPSASFSTAVESQTSPAKPALTTPEGIPYLLRLRTSLNYLTSTYLPQTLRPLILSLLAPKFTTLDIHLAAIAELKSEAAALRSISDNISRKRAIEEDDEKMAEREEKKRKKEEEDKKKKAEGRGIKQLKKVDTSGMKKMSAFFTKVPKKA